MVNALEALEQGGAVIPALTPQPHPDWANFDCNHTGTHTHPVMCDEIIRTLPLRTHPFPNQQRRLAKDSPQTHIKSVWTPQPYKERGRESKQDLPNHHSDRECAHCQRTSPRSRRKHTCTSTHTYSARYAQQHVLIAHTYCIHTCTHAHTHVHARTHAYMQH